jgi:hypothetical protein
MRRITVTLIYATSSYGILTREQLSVIAKKMIIALMDWRSSGNSTADQSPFLIAIASETYAGVSTPVFTTKCSQAMPCANIQITITIVSALLEVFGIRIRGLVQDKAREIIP